MNEAGAASGDNDIISAKNLDLHYQSVTFGTFGSFGASTWSVITRACDSLTHPRAADDCNPWNAPGPKRDFTLSLGFALQRANSNMLRGADRRRRAALHCIKLLARQALPCLVHVQIVFVSHRGYYTTAPASSDSG